MCCVVLHSRSPELAQPQPRGLVAVDVADQQLSHPTVSGCFYTSQMHLIQLFLVVSTHHKCIQQEQCHICHYCHMHIKCYFTEFIEVSFSLIPSWGDGSPPQSSPGSSTGVLGRFDSGDLAMTPAVPGHVQGSVTSDVLPSLQHHCSVDKWQSLVVR